MNKKYISFDKNIDNNLKQVKFNGLIITETDDFFQKSTFREGEINGVWLINHNNKKSLSIGVSILNYKNFMEYYIYDDYTSFLEYDLDFELSEISCNSYGQIKYRNDELIKAEESNIHMIADKIVIKKIEEVYKDSKQSGGASFKEMVGMTHLPGVSNKLEIAWALERKHKMEKGLYDSPHSDYVPFYIEQEKVKLKTLMTNRLPANIDYIAGVDVAYNELEQRMVGAIVVLDAETLEIVDQAVHEMDITFPYIPGLFSFREIPPILEAYKKIKIKPDIIVCDAHGIAHPKGVGMATHLGVELDIPTIGCAKKRLVGYYNKEELGVERGSTQDMIWASEKVGVALRTQDNTRPLFVSIGHKIDLETAVEWVLKLCRQYRLPETTRQSDQLVNKILKERTEIDFLDD